MHEQELPDNVISGELARLIPVFKDSDKERKATSVLLAGLMSVSEYARRMLSTIGAPSTKTTKVRCFSEVVFKTGLEKENLRPDGLIVATLGNRTWKALVESKVGNTDLEATQIENYLDLARRYGIDAVITISNQFATLPTHHPVKISGQKTRTVNLYHWSWMGLVSEAMMLVDNKGVSDPEQAYILTEIIRYLNSDNTGVLADVRVGKSWKALCENIRDNGAITLPNAILAEVVEDWYQIGRYVALVLSTATGVNVTVSMSAAHRSNPQSRAAEDMKILQSDHCLYLELDVPGAASPIYISADMGRRVMDVTMWLKPPQDKKRSPACVTWLVRQLAACKDESLLLRALFRKASLNTCKPLAQVRVEPKVILPDDLAIIPTGFEISRVSDNVTRFMGQKTFVEDISKLVVGFYGEVGEQLVAWVPPAPQVKDQVLVEIPPQPDAEVKEADTDKGLLRGLLSRLPLN